MIDINGIIEKNKEYVAKHPELAQKGLTSHPTKKLAIVTCMDTRLVGMLEESLGLIAARLLPLRRPAIA